MSRCRAAVHFTALAHAADHSESPPASVATGAPIPNPRLVIDNEFECSIFSQHRPFEPHLPCPAQAANLKMSIPTQIAETVQTAHIQRDPSPHHDLNPSTSASIKEPVRISHPDQHSQLDEDDDVVDVRENEDDDEIPISVLRPHRRRHDFPPMPDLRFEQSYLHSIEGAQSWGRIAWITIRDQVGVAP